MAVCMKGVGFVFVYESVCVYDRMNGNVYI